MACQAIYPDRNHSKDLDDIPANAREQMNFVWLETVDDALEAALDGVTAGDAAA